jgi:curved DNA-binding protein CbpA
VNYYYLLGISPRASPDEVRKAYFKLVKIYHPDKNKSPEATEKMAEINLAYEILSNINKREEYDLENRIGADDTDESITVQYEEEEEIGQELETFGKCAKCNFVNNSGMFVCSTCGYVFDPDANHGRKVHDEQPDEESTEDSLSEIIRCPRCNEISMYSRGLCWQCGLHFEVDEIA